ncbi:KH domain-containing, RNA-binding, signal transduction-associated protein 2-like isoform X2 [Bactrocera neohumeralis]|uniref:KH domain-containing, RNA-binding, signal transduction-associated protein 2-like isoform X2 n=1 Tax=Bactrocera neohumeralis TaxID=98809 RepID=UPI0021652041|nr:KH domain-containing, RNA-binding, signal transduction-associated protein 2-like isoform X2 [Bactrocera neohumeralis]
MEKSGSIPKLPHSGYTCTTKISFLKFLRKEQDMAEHVHETNNAPKEEENETPRINNFAQKFLADLDEERERLGADFPLCALLIDEAFERVYSTGRIPGREYYADVYQQKPIKVTQKVFVPVKQFPKFNFTGKILGPKGNSLRRLQEETQCKIVIKGRNSIRDRTKEEEMRESGDPRFAHLNRSLYVEISTIAAPAECYARIAYALAEIRKYLVPDKNDDVSHEQLLELMEIDPKSAKQYSRSILDKKMMTGPSSSKFYNLARHGDQQGMYQNESDEEVYETKVHTRLVTPIHNYGYVKAPYKRPPTAIYGTELKRTRDTTIKSYKPPSFGIIKKYK